MFCIIQICQVGVGVKLLTQAVDPLGFCLNIIKLYALIGLIFYNEHFVSNSKTKRKQKNPTLTPTPSKTPEALGFDYTEGSRQLSASIYPIYTASILSLAYR